MAEVQDIGVVGAGFMGSGIAESAARAGLRVRVYEPNEAPLQASRTRIAASVERAVRGGKMDTEAAAALQERITFSSELHSLHGAELVIEAIVEDLDVKRDIIQNAIDLAHALGRTSPKVAILSAMETVNPSVPSTIEAAALCKMADRGQITGGILDGPLALDNAIDLGAAKIKNIRSPVAGQANVLVVPNLEAGNMLAKSLTFLADADAAGIVLGARVPIILTSRADTLFTRLASCAVAVLVAAARRKSAAAAIS